jgi:hypothetical protein
LEKNNPLYLDLAYQAISRKDYPVTSTQEPAMILKMENLKFSPITGDPGPYDRVAGAYLNGTYVEVKRCTYDGLYDIACQNVAVAVDLTEAQLYAGVPLPTVTIIGNRVHSDRH